jgi:hypothetical protein
MPVRLRVYNHISELFGLDDSAFAIQVERLKKRLSRSNPVAVLTRRTIDDATEALANAPDRDVLLRHVLQRRVPGAARTLLAQLSVEIPPVEGRIVCHLLPTGGDRGSGNAFGAYRFLAAVPCRGDVASWLAFVIAHEYSHTQRGYRLDHNNTVRDFLIFEGLGMVLGEAIAPEIGRTFREGATDEQVTNFWSAADLEARGLESYVEYMGRDGAYEAGARVVRSYLQLHGLSIAAAHRLTNQQLYWESGYPLVR